MKKSKFKSKTVQGIVLFLAGVLWGIWSGESEISATVAMAGLGWAGYGYRDAMD